ncbi:hypothetical protein PoB_003084500 [Plakobranchus ocellatus]|uniref:Uncharacterized protein n=1 Tax=Plakobranchus ocellatus TaxID=259542 RepID=A0AAV4AAC5_9GAST|nr:hypothetical protein PoB_003084500 [Plakobranchus ocellatus]
MLLSTSFPDIFKCKSWSELMASLRGVGSSVASEYALRSAGTLQARVRAPPPAPWPDGGPESLRSPCCGLAIYKYQNHYCRPGW